MASNAQVALDDQLLKFKTWVLKVSIHCEGCKRKVKKLLHKINGVYTISIDSQQQRVTVTGNVGVEAIITRLVKKGKHAEIWPANLAGEQKKVAGKYQTNGKQKHSAIMESQPQAKATKKTSETVKSTEKDESQLSKERENSPEKKKKKRKGQNGNISGDYGGPADTGTMPHLNQTQSYYSYYSTDYWPSSLVHADRSYAASHPIQMPQSWPYTCASSDDQEIYNSLEIFSDENANGCSIM